MADQRRYAALLAKGEDRRQRILTVAQRLVARNGGRGTTLSQIARAAGVSPAGLLHHLHDRFLDRYRDTVAIVTESIRRGQLAGRYRADLDPAIKAMEIIAFLF